MNFLYEVEKWDNKFKDRPNQIMGPENFLVENIDFLQKGSLLDVACGDGRNAVFLAKLGFEVLGVDYSSEGLKRVKYFADEAGVVINTKIVDLSQLGEVEELGAFDNIIINHFKPTNEVMEALPKLLKTEGILVINTFNFLQSVEKGFSRDYCLEKDELIDKYHELKLIKHFVYQDTRGYLDGYIFQKN